MKLIVGLGNPGVQYETTRHNAGFLAADRLIERFKAQGPTLKNQGELYSARFRDEPLMLIKPLTYMNLSGQCVGPIYRFYKCQPEDVIVIHDEVDLPSLALRLKTGGGTGGHNGLKSLDQMIGSPAYHRIRIGVGKPGPEKKGMDTADHVLGQFSDQELKDLDLLLDDVGEAIELILQGQMGKAMTRFNQTPKQVKA